MAATQPCYRHARIAGGNACWPYVRCHWIATTVLLNTHSDRSPRQCTPARDGHHLSRAFRRSWRCSRQRSACHTLRLRVYAACGVSLLRCVLLWQIGDSRASADGQRAGAATHFEIQVPQGCKIGAGGTPVAAACSMFRAGPIVWNGGLRSHQRKEADPVAHNAARERLLLLLAWRRKGVGAQWRERGARARARW